MLDVSGQTGTRSGMPPVIAISIRSFDVTLSPSNHKKRLSFILTLLPLTGKGSTFFFTLPFGNHKSRRLSLVLI
jgi:hypothetical protein